MRVLGINCLNHDASIAIVENNRILYHKKGDGHFLTNEIMYAAKWFRPDIISFIEKPYLKKLRQLYSGEYHKLFDQLPHNYVRSFGIGFDIPYVYQYHHKSHAATSYFTSQFDDAVIFVFDAIGEWDCTTVWKAEGNTLTKLYSEKYPHSLGLFYAAFTDLYGYKPNSDEQLLYVASTIGEAKYKKQVASYLKRNVHKGIKDWDLPIDFDLAASVQNVFVDKVDSIVNRFKHVSKNAVFSGGCSMNSYINTIGKTFDNFHVYRPSGDVSSSIGAAILVNPCKIIT